MNAASRPSGAVGSALIFATESAGSDSLPIWASKSIARTNDCELLTLLNPQKLTNCSLAIDFDFESFNRRRFKTETHHAEVLRKLASFEGMLAWVASTVATITTALSANRWSC